MNGFSGFGNSPLKGVKVKPREGGASNKKSTSKTTSKSVLGGAPRIIPSEVGHMRRPGKYHHILSAKHYKDIKKGY